MNKYQLHSLRPKIDGYIFPEPQQEEVKKRLKEAGFIRNGIDKDIGFYVICESKPVDFPEMGLWWIEVDNLISLQDVNS